MQSSNIRSNSNRSSTEINKNKQKLKKSPSRQPSLPRSIHVEPKKKPPKCSCKFDCYFFKPQNIFKVLKASYWLILSSSLVPFVLGIIGLGYDGSNWYGSVPQVQRVVFPIYLSISIIQAIICCWQISKIYNLEVKQINPLIVLFLFSLSYIVLAVIGKTKFMEIYDNRHSASSCNQYYDQLVNPSILSDLQLAIQNFCVKSQNCLCLIDKPSQFANSTLSSLYYTTVGYGVTTSLNCPNINQYNLTPSGPKILQNLELKFSCSGICTPLPVFYFSDINRGPPKQDSCYAILLDELEIISHIIWLPILIVAGVMIFLQLIIALAARQYIRDPDCIDWRIASFQRHMTAQINMQQSLGHSHSIQQGLNGNILNNTASVGNNSTLFQQRNIDNHSINGANFGIDAVEENSEFQNNSLVIRNENGIPNKKMTQSILINNNMNEQRQSPSNLNNHNNLTKKVTIFAPNSDKNNENSLNEPTNEIEISKTTQNQKRKIQLIAIQDQQMHINQEQ
ncbi:transmembrane protein, putative (macronuclear) [Tetrahymena thermophila SB210]|uniref:Transmembrane protein, putative n=1 Tax=Tetrahymena thermophila (strain SB210) TaxID=312017 RepID=Q22YN7_TETTS|nr:transmembrane protein, putative [Tetrahymena thermophila SB210]EAR90634.2 transmembrane protein, putative [Tetrahymena thermophila SB210]|eukprot:XP_001010879.2 transmembrane protein, putative [Tetrahymena thermophila SB210]